MRETRLRKAIRKYLEENPTGLSSKEISEAMAANGGTKAKKPESIYQSVTHTLRTLEVGGFVVSEGKYPKRYFPGTRTE